MKILKDCRQFIRKADIKLILLIALFLFVCINAFLQIKNPLGFADNGEFNYYLNHNGIKNIQKVEYFEFSDPDNYVLNDKFNGSKIRDTMDVFVKIVRHFAKYNDQIFDLRFLGAIFVSIFLAGLGILIYQLRKIKNPALFATGAAALTFIGINPDLLAYMPTIYRIGPFIALLTALIGLLSISIHRQKRLFATLLVIPEVILLLLIGLLQDCFFPVMMLFIPVVAYCFIRDMFPENREKQITLLAIAATLGFFIIMPLSKVQNNYNGIVKYNFYMRHLLPVMNDPAEFLTDEGVHPNAIKETLKNFGQSYWQNPLLYKQGYSTIMPGLPGSEIYLTHPRLLWRAFKGLNAVNSYHQISPAYTPLGITSRQNPKDKPVKYYQAFTTLLPTPVFVIIMLVAAMIIICRAIMFFRGKKSSMGSFLLHCALTALPLTLLATGLPLYPLDESRLMYAVSFTIFMLGAESAIGLYRLITGMEYFRKSEKFQKYFLFALREITFAGWIFFCCLVMEYTFRGTLLDIMPYAKNFYSQFLMVYTVFLPVQIILGKKAAGLIALSLALMWGISNCVKMKMLGEPLVPDNFFSFTHVWQTMLFVKDSAAFVFVCAAAVLTVAAVVLTICFDRSWHYTRKRFIIFAAAAICSATVLAVVPFENAEKDEVFLRMNTADQYKRGSLLLSFMAFSKRDIIKPEPEAFQYLAAQKAEIAETAAKFPPSPVKPHIIVILNESAVNLERFKNLVFPDGSPYDVQRLAKWSRFSPQHQTFSGKLHVPIFGGLTANAEFETITGISANMLHVLPYALLTDRRIRTLADSLKTAGYSTTYIHPNTKYFYSRNEVMPNLGFERFLSLEDAPQSEERFKFYQDADFYKWMLDYLEKNNSTPQFLYGSSIQNHMPYDATRFKQAKEISFSSKVPLSPDQTDMLKYYLKGISLSSAAIEKFLTDLNKKMSHPTIVIIFGDHQPQFRDIYQILNPSYTHSMYETEYFIWSNFKMPHPEVLPPTMKSFELVRRTTVASGALPADSYIYLFDQLHKSPQFMSNWAPRMKSFFTGTQLEPERDKFFRMYHAQCYKDFMDQE